MKKGYFGEYGGSYVPDNLRKELDKVYQEYKKLKKEKKFKAELDNLQKTYQGRPTPLYYCKRLSKETGGADIYLKREDLNHTGAHKINHCIGEALLAKHLGKKKIIGETGAGQHGLALATAAALLGLECDIYMGAVDVAKQAVNVQKMEILGARVVCVNAGTKTLKEAVDSSFKAYCDDFENSLYCIGSVVGPHPFPSIVRDFQSVVGKEAKKQFKQLKGILPDAVVACVGGGSNAMGIFNEFLKNPEVKLYGVEALGRGYKMGDNSASVNFGTAAVLHGTRSLVLLDDKKEVVDAYSIASGLDYPGVGPQHAYLHQICRAEYVLCDDKEALNAFYTLIRTEGIIPALESSHAVAYGIKLAKELGKGKNIIVNLSGRGDKDLDFVLNLDKKQNEF